MNITARFVLIFLVLCLPGLIAAQQSNASLTGTVSDSNGAVIAGATVTATNQSTNFRRTVTTNEQGSFTFSFLPVGQYEVKISFGGFADTRDSVTLYVGQTLSYNKTMYPRGASVDPVFVNASSNVDTQTSKVDAVITDRAIENLPLNGRNFLELALLTPGNSLAPNFDPTKSNTVVISSAGQVGRGGNVMIDGTDNNDDVVGGSLLNISQDAVQEFQVATNRFSAELGRSASSAINVVTKSGTNIVHGSAAFYERDRRIQGLPATFDRSQTAPPFGRQQYSFTLGGPIIKDKLFAFGAVEYRDQAGAVLVGVRDVADPKYHTRFRTGSAKRPTAKWQGRLSGECKERFEFSLFVRRCRCPRFQQAGSGARVGQLSAGPKEPVSFIYGRRGNDTFVEVGQ